MAFTITPVLTLATSVWADLGTLGAVVLASVASGAIAFPVARNLGVARLYRWAKRSDPELAAASLVACASLVHEPGFNIQASMASDPLIDRAIALAASGASAEEVRRELTVDPPSAPRPVIAWAPVVGLVIALAGLAAVASAATFGLIAGAPFAIALVVALYSAFFLSTVAGACDERAVRLEPSDVLTRALIAAAVPAIRDGADSATVEQILRPMLVPGAGKTAQPTAGRRAA